MDTQLSKITDQTMSSLEIVKIINELRENGAAELQHSDFLKKIVKVLGDQVAGNFSGYYIALNGKKNPCFNLPKREAQLMVMSESYKVQAAVYDRMTELEASQNKLPGNYLEALKELVAVVEKNAALEEKVKSDEPKVIFAEKVRALDGSISIGDFAKLIGTGQNRFFARLREDGFLMINNHPKQAAIDRGLLVQVESTPYTDSKGKSHPALQTRITGKGQVYFEKRYRD